MKNIIWFLMICLQKILSILPIDKNKVFAMNYYGKGYGDNCKYVTEELIKLNPKIEIIWPLKKCEMGEKPNNVKPVKYYSFSFFYYLCTSGTWISNVRLPFFFIKRKEQYYIQLWHGLFALKRIEADAENALDSGYIKSAKHDSEIANLIISNSTEWTNLVKRAFWYNREILECGTPRVAPLYKKDEDKQKQIYNRLGISYEKKILLYAPTFRADFSLDSYTLDFQNLKTLLEKSFGGSWVIGIRLHPNLLGKGITFSNNHDVIELTKYPDMYELLSITSLLITDYSSTMFEAGFANINVILYASDIDEYKKDRNFYYDFSELPFPLAKTNEELTSIIENWNQELYNSNNKIFAGKVGLKENGSASEKIAKLILKNSE